MSRYSLAATIDHLTRLVADYRGAGTGPQAGPHRAPIFLPLVTMVLARLYATVGGDQRGVARLVGQAARDTALLIPSSANRNPTLR
jgi:hypothetical protein